MAPPKIRTPLHAEQRPESLQLAESVAAFARALTFYPETNTRVRSSLEDVLASARRVFDAAEAGSGQEDQVVLVFTRGSVAIGSQTHQVSEGSNLAWLAERYEACGLAGMAVSVDMPPESLVGFCKTLLDSFRRSTLDSDFDATSFAEFPGLRPLERRFEGTFDGTGTREGSDVQAMLQEQELCSREHRLAERLLQNGEIQSRIEALAAEHPESDGEEGVMTSTDLLARVVRALPIEAVQDPEHVIAHTMEVLDTVASGSGFGTGTDTGEDRDPLSRVLLSASLNLFGRRNWGPEAAHESEDEDRVLVEPAARGHAQDDRVTDDLEALLSEFAELPEPEDAELTMVRAEDPAEQIGVYMHHLVNFEDDEKARMVHRPLAKLLSVLGSDQREVARSYVEVLSPQSSVQVDQRHRGRVLEFLYAAGLTRLLADFGAFSGDMALQLFPEDFGVYLDSLDLKQPAEHAELARLFATLGPARVLEASDQLVGEGRLLDPERVAAMLARPDPAMAPIARIVLARGDPGLKSVVAPYVRSLGPTGEETCLLQLLTDEELPRDYLADLLDPPVSQGAVRKLHERISATLVDFVRDTSGLEARSGHRIAAIRMLALFQTPDATALLQELVGSRRFLVGRKESAAVREAAKSSLACHV